MQRAGAVGRVVDAEVIVHVGGNDKVLQLPAGSTQLQGRFQGIVAAPIERNFAAVELGARLRGDVDDARGAVAELGRQRARQDAHRLDHPGIDFLAKTVESFRQEDAVDAVLDIAVVAADVHFPKFLLDHAGRLQQHLLKGGVFALTHQLNLGRIDRIGDGAQAGSYFLAGGIEISRDSNGRKFDRSACWRRWRKTRLILRPRRHHRGARQEGFENYPRKRASPPGPRIIAVRKLHFWS